MPGIFSKREEPQRRRRSAPCVLPECPRLFSPTENSSLRCSSPFSPRNHRKWSAKRRTSPSPVERYRRVGKEVLGRPAVNNEALKEIPMFKDCNHLFMDQLAKDAGVEAYQEGEVILREGDPADKLYLLNRGTVAVEVGGKVVANLHDGSIFGEMALLSKKSSTRNATVRAMSFCDCRVLHNSCFQRLLKLFPVERHFFEREAMRRQAELDAMKAKPQRRASTNAGGSTPMHPVEISSEEVAYPPGYVSLGSSLNSIPWSCPPNGAAVEAELQRQERDADRADHDKDFTTEDFKFSIAALEAKLQRQETKSDKAPWTLQQIEAALPFGRVKTS